MDLLAFKVVIEPDEDAWRSYYPAWEHVGASSCVETQEEAAVDIKKVLEMIVREIEEGSIQWPIEPAPSWDFCKPSIQDLPDLLQVQCAPEYPDAIASHGGLPVAELNPDVVSDDTYRLVYVAMDDVLAAKYERDILREARTGGYAATVIVPPIKSVPDTLPHERNTSSRRPDASPYSRDPSEYDSRQYGYVSRGQQVRLTRERQRKVTLGSSDAVGANIEGNESYLNRAVNYQQIRNVSAREIENALFRDGFILSHQTGSHRRYSHEAFGRRVSISWHGRSQTFKIATLRSIVEAQAQWTEADLIRLGLISG